MTEVRCHEACWGDVEPPTAAAFEGFQKGHKKILVVYKLICFHGFVFIAKQSSKAARADRALDCCMLWASLTNMMTKPTNRMEDTDGTCILLYRNEIFYMMQVS